MTGSSGWLWLTLPLSILVARGSVRCRWFGTWAA